ncbi:MAG: hypothetical protein MJZ63_02665 [Muribaculaceae bacterium]|nr:hypothetical protein [Muribaculaceae bacterium]
MKKIIFALIIATFALSANARLRQNGKLPQQDVYKIMNTYTKTWVKLQHSMLADITGTEADASELYVAHKTQADGEAVLTTLSGDGGDMIETLNMIKGLIEEVLKYYNKPTWFLDAMFELHLVNTGDADGSVYLCVDVPEIEGWDEIKEIILDAADGQEAVTYYINHMVPGNRHYMHVDYDGSFGYSTQAGITTKWVMNHIAYPETKFYYTKNVEADYMKVVDEGFTTETTSLLARNTKPGAVQYMELDEHGFMAKFRSQGEELVANTLSQLRSNITIVASQYASSEDLSDILADTYIRLGHTNTSEDKFEHDTYLMRLHIGDMSNNPALEATWNQVCESILSSSNSNAVLKAVKAANLTIKSDNDLYIAMDEDGALKVTDINGLDELGDLAKWKFDLIDSDDNFFAAAPYVEFDGQYFTTLYTDFAYDIVNPSEVKAYVVPEIAEDGATALVKINGTVPACTPVVIAAKSRVQFSNMLQPVVSDATYNGTNKLLGVFFDEKKAVDNSTYTLRTENDQLGFYRSADTFIPGNEAWLEKQDNNKPVIIVVPEDPSTAITTVIADKKQDSTIYDLMGRKVASPAPGIYIQNRQKITIK